MADQPALDVGGRLRQYRRRVKLATLVGAGLILVVALFTGVAPNGAPRNTGFAVVLWMLVPTFVLIAGLFLGYARAHFEWLADLLQPRADANSGELMTVAAGALGIPASWPMRAEILYWMELLFTVLAGVTLGFLVWWPGLVGPADSRLPSSDQLILSRLDAIEKAQEAMKSTMDDRFDVIAGQAGRLSEDAKARLDGLNELIKSSFPKYNQPLILKIDEMSSKVDKVHSILLEEGAPEKREPGPNVYVVKPGDTLTSISGVLSLSVDDLVRLNGITNRNLIYPGQRFRY